MDKKEIYNNFRKNVFLCWDRFLSCYYDKTKNIDFNVLNKVSLYCGENKENIFKALLPIMVILMGVYSCNGNERRIAKDVENIFAMTDDIRLYFSDKADYWGLNTDYIIKNNVINDSFVKDGKIVLGIDKNVLVGRGSAGEIILPRSNNFDVVLKNIDKVDCEAYLKANISDENQMKLLSISIENEVNKYTFEWGNNQYPLPVDKSSADNVCANSPNTIIWTVR